MVQQIRTPLPVYTTGTVAGNAAQPVVTGNGTAWMAAIDALGDLVNTVMPGDLFITATQAIPIKSVDSATQVTLECPLPSTINAGSAYRIIKISPNLSGGVTQALAALMALGSDASPDQSSTIDNGAGRLKLRVAANGDLQLAVGPSGTADSALTVVFDVAAGGAISYPNDVTTAQYKAAINALMASNATVQAASGPTPVDAFYQAMVGTNAAANATVNGANYFAGAGTGAEGDPTVIAWRCHRAPSGGPFDVLVSTWLTAVLGFSASAAASQVTSLRQNALTQPT